MQEKLESLQSRMAEQLRSMRKMHNPTGHCHCLTCYQIVALLVEHDTAEQETDELLTIAYMSGQADEAARHRKTKEALNALLNYIDQGGVFPEGWDWEKIREISK